jgi:hypothetical protein
MRLAVLRGARVVRNEQPRYFALSSAYGHSGLASVRSLSKSSNAHEQQILANQQIGAGQT